MISRWFCLLITLPRPRFHSSNLFDSKQILFFFFVFILCHLLHVQLEGLISSTHFNNHILIESLNRRSNYLSWKHIQFNSSVQSSCSFQLHSLVYQIIFLHLFINSFSLLAVFYQWNVEVLLIPPMQTNFQFYWRRVIGWMCQSLEEILIRN